MEDEMTHFRKLFVCTQNAGSMPGLGGLGYFVY